MMTTIAIVHEEPTRIPPRFRATSGNREAVGHTMGEALDALMAQWNPPSSTAVLIRRFGPDEFFTQAQHERMQELLALRSARTPEQEQELESLIDAELDATVARTERLLSDAQK